MKIRKAKKEDVNAIEEVYGEAHIDEAKLQFPKVSRKVMKKEMIKERKSRKAEMRKNLKINKNYYIVAEEDKEIIGFGHAYIKNREIGIVESFYVNKKNRGKGVAKKLIKELINWLKKKKLKHIESNALAKNIPSLKLQEKFGFKPYFVRTRLK